ncbi:MAG: pyroglutamyl-peptidase I [Pirellulales bacterium]
MLTVLLTAFEPYGPWQENASWLALVELTRNMPQEPQVTTRRYPVDFGEVQARLAKDLQANYDVVLHLGQAPGDKEIRLEAIGLNLGQESSESPFCLTDNGPVAFRSELPLADWTRRIDRAGIPARVSYHAGLYLCNAILYWTHYQAEVQGLKSRATLLHLPLDSAHGSDQGSDTPTLPAATSARAVRLILEELVAEADGV